MNYKDAAVHLRDLSDKFASLSVVAAELDTLGDLSLAKDSAQRALDNLRDATDSAAADLAKLNEAIRERSEYNDTLEIKVSDREKLAELRAKDIIDAANAAAEDIVSAAQRTSDKIVSETNEHLEAAKAADEQVAAATQLLADLEAKLERARSKVHELLEAGD